MRIVEWKYHLESIQFVEYNIEFHEKLEYVHPYDMLLWTGQIQLTGTC